MHYHIIAAEAVEPLASRMEQNYPDRFTFHPTKWNKFPDGTDNIEIGGFSPRNLISGEHILFLASFHNNDVTLSQFQVMICLLQSFIESLTVVLPYSPVGTMERVTREGQVATAATYAHMFSSLPTCGRPTRLMVYDLHTLQNRFYLHGTLQKCKCSFSKDYKVLTVRAHDRKRRRKLTERDTTAQAPTQRLQH